MKILLVGNPNVGKSVVFNRLTGIDVISSNYPGTTIDFTKGYLNIGSDKAELIDVPGTYTLEPTNKAEEIAVHMLGDGDVIINVVDATNLERNLFLTLQLISRQKPMIIALNLIDEAKHTGISIHIEKLQEILDIPCIPTCALTGQGIKELVEAVKEARISSFKFNNDQRWNEIGVIISKVQTIIHKHHTFTERLSDFSVKPLTGIPLLIIVLLLTFALIRLIGESLINYALDPFFERVWAPLMLKFSVVLGQKGILHDLLIGKLINGGIDFGQSFGLLTTGLYVPLGAVLPYVIAFYIVLGFLEDSGYLPRAAVMVDTVMHRLGLHGLAVIPVLLGLGCNVPGVLGTRILETRKEKFIAATLISIAVPCMALQAMIIGLVGQYGIKGLGIVSLTLFIVFILAGIILRKMVRGSSPEIFVEIPPYRMPYIKGLIKKVWIRLKWFIKEAIPFVLLGVLIANLLYTFGIIQFIGRVTAPVFTKVLGLPQEAAGALLMGFLRKDVAVGMLIPLHMTLKQLIVASVVLSMYFPCVATFATLFRELGTVDMLKSTGIMILATLITGGVLNLILSVVPL